MNESKGSGNGPATDEAIERISSQGRKILA
jgi:hypothetical protein